MKLKNMLFVLVCIVACVGCQPDSIDDVVIMDELPPELDDDSLDEGPRGGRLLELGNEEYHAEVVVEGSIVTVRLLDASASEPVEVDALHVTINCLHDGKPEPFKLASAPEDSTLGGRSSRFQLDNDDLARHIDDESSKPSLSVLIDGIPYRSPLVP